MADESLITSRDSRGRHIVGLLEVALDNAHLDRPGAQRIVEKGGEVQEAVTQLLKERAMPPPTTPAAATRRIQFEFSPDAVERLDKLKAQCGATSYAELVRNALRVFEWVHNMEKDGNEIGVVKDDKLLKTVTFLY